MGLPAPGVEVGQTPKRPDTEETGTDNETTKPTTENM
jgi:hypothetical protein